MSIHRHAKIKVDHYWALVYCGKVLFCLLVSTKMRKNVPKVKYFVIMTQGKKQQRKYY